VNARLMGKAQDDGGRIPFTACVIRQFGVRLEGRKRTRRVVPRAEYSPAGHLRADLTVLYRLSRTTNTVPRSCRPPFSVVPLKMTVRSGREPGRREPTVAGSTGEGMEDRFRPLYLALRRRQLEDHAARNVCTAAVFGRAVKSTAHMHDGRVPEDGFAGDFAAISSLGTLLVPAPSCPAE
jgi:hypothetical protein